MPCGTICSTSAEASSPAKRPSSAAPLSKPTCVVSTASAPTSRSPSRARKREGCAALGGREETLGELEMIHLVLPLLEIDTHGSVPRNGDQRQLAGV